MEINRTDESRKIRMDMAIADVASGTTIYHASKKHNIPRASIIYNWPALRHRDTRPMRDYEHGVDKVRMDLALQDVSNGVPTSVAAKKHQLPIESINLRTNRTGKEKRQNNYSIGEDKVRMDSAVADVRLGMPVHRASVEHQVSKTALYRRVRLLTFNGGSTRFGAVFENELVAHIKKHAVSVAEAYTIVKDYIDTNNLTHRWKNRYPSRDWLTQVFCKRHGLKQSDFREQSS
jgi:hypothetical protein